MKIAIIGAGLIGGSFAKACKARDVASVIIAIDSDESSLALLQEEGAIDVAYPALCTEAVAEADIIVIATPPHSWQEIASQLAPLLTSRTQCIMDVGSVKHYALQCFGGLPHFVATHPIAGSEFSGAAFSVAALFEGKRVIVTPTPETDATALAQAESLWQRVGAHTVMVEAHTHDSIYAYVSHLPQLLAFAIGNAWLAQGLPPETQSVKASFYRLCGSSPTLWTGIIAHNPALKEATETYLRLLTHMIAELNTGALSHAEESITALGLELAPRILASCLISCITLAEKKGNIAMARYAGAGFADMAHPAMSDPADDLARISEHTNAVIACLHTVEKTLRALLLAIHEGDWQNVQAQLQQGQEYYVNAMLERE